MASNTMVSRLIDLASELADQRSSASRRRAVSTAYYAVFHAVAKVCADALVNVADRQSVDYLRVYRALDHGPLKSAWAAKESPLYNEARLKRIGNLVVPLQSERIRADYLPPLPHPFTQARATELVDQAKEAIYEITRLSEEDAETMAIWLLFKTR